MEDEPALARYVPALRAYFRRRANSADVEDLVQEVLVSMQARSSLAPILNVDSYLFTIASHVLSKHYRKAQKTSSTAAMLQVFDAQTDEISPERLAVARADLETAKRAILSLPERTRTIFLLHRFEHRTYPEIARQLSISVSAIEKHMMRAMRALLQARKSDR
jgi:RNA polymerase sigma-70 factor (ECF subfamily)